ncbi:MAG TPA: helix-turn-helix domain-containing protein [Gaiellaceae bacterium]|nr:helix-turn-helix domain-containing protein [Gaiellaceae bacterium]
MLQQMQLMPIGRFSRLTGVGVKALRHYDEVGILVPAAVDDETGYRFYSPDQVDRAEAIRLLRRLDMPLDEIRSTLAAGDPAALRAALVSHQREIATRESELRASRGKLQRLIDGRDTIMGMRSESLQAEDHRRLGIDLYNRTWTLMDSPGEEMLYCAHASAYHWMQGGGTTANRARSEWLCSRVYAILGRPEPALHHARRCLELVESSPEEMEDWDLAGAYEALARASLTAGDTEDARRFHDLGREATAEIADPEDRKHIEADLDAMPL